MFWFYIKLTVYVHIGIYTFIITATFQDVPVAQWLRESNIFRQIC